MIDEIKTHKEVKEEILKILKEEWVENSNLRLFQFLFNYTQINKNHKEFEGVMWVRDPFYDIDETTLENLKDNLQLE